MGNTKYISWFGVFKKEFESGIIFATDESRDKCLLAFSNGSYCAAQHHSGTYLTTDHASDTVYCQGIIHTHSIIGNKFIDALIRQCEYCTVTLFDLDFPLLIIYDTVDGKTKITNLSDQYLDKNLHKDD